MEDIEWCQDITWKPLFPANVFKTEFIDVPDAFLKYTELDGILLEPDDSDDPLSEILRHEDIGHLIRKINEGILRVGGKGAVPKVNWSSPKDAVWMRPLKCGTAKDVFLLLKSSDFIRDDIELAKKSGLAVYLSLVRFHDLDDQLNFRCFVRGREIIGISQRNISEYYGNLFEGQDKIKSIILSFFHEVIQDLCPLERYCVDLYVQKKRLYIVGFSPWSENTDSLLFTWEELAEVSGVELRLVDSESIQPSTYHNFRFPIDLSYSDNLEEFIQAIKSSNL